MELIFPLLSHTNESTQHIRLRDRSGETVFFPFFFSFRHVFSSTKNKTKKIELGEGRFALRAFSNGRFVRVVPPEPEAFSMWNVWKLEVSCRLKV